MITVIGEYGQRIADGNATIPKNVPRMSSMDFVTSLEAYLQFTAERQDDLMVRQQIPL